MMVMHPRPRISRGFILVLAAGFLILAMALFMTSPALAIPTITWIPASMTEMISAGESKTVPVSFTTSENVSDVEVQVVPELQPFVQVDPQTFKSLAKGKTYNLTITISASRDSLSGTVQGTIQLRRGSGPRKTYARPLPVTITLVTNQAPVANAGDDINAVPFVPITLTAARATTRMAIS